MNTTTRIHISLLRQLSRFQSRSRWHQARDRAEIRVDYGFDLVPGRSQFLSGGLVKCQDLIHIFPADRLRPNLLYLVSSALPHDADIQIRACRRAGGIFVLNQNGVAYPGWHGPGWERANAPMAFAHGMANGVVYQSEFCRLGAERFLGHRSGPARLLHNPVDTTVFTPPPTPPEGGPVLLVAGTHQFRYRAETALHTLAKTRKHLPGATLIVAGQHTWAPTDEALYFLETLAAKLGVTDALEFHPPYAQSEAPALFHRAHFLLHPKYNDPCPRLVVEAMACGLPVIHSATGGLPELVPPGSDWGVPGPHDYAKDHPPDPAALAECIFNLWPHWETASQLARRHAVEHLDVRTWIDAHTAFFQELLAS